MVKNGANIFYFLSPIFCQIGYYQGIKVTIGLKKIQKWGKNPISSVLPHVHIKNKLCGYGFFLGQLRIYLFIKTSLSLQNLFLYSMVKPISDEYFPY